MNATAGVRAVSREVEPQGLQQGQPLVEGGQIGHADFRMQHADGMGIERHDARQAVVQTSGGDQPFD
jgi:hypothetical protein